MEKVLEKGMRAPQVSGSKPKRKYNLSAYFLLPIILDLGSRYKGLVNTYIYNTSTELTNDANHLYVELHHFDINLSKHKSYVSDVETNNKTYLYTFDISKYRHDVELFIQGKYSKMSQDLKDLLCRNSGVRPEMLSDIYKILYRTEDRKKYIEDLVGEKLMDDEEVCSSPDIDSEIFN